MKKAVLWVQIAVLIIQVVCVVLLVFEIYGHMNTNNIITEAVILGICLIVNIVCAVYRLCIEKK